MNGRQGLDATKRKHTLQTERARGCLLQAFCVAPALSIVVGKTRTAGKQIYFCLYLHRVVLCTSFRLHTSSLNRRCSLRPRPCSLCPRPCSWPRHDPVAHVRLVYASRSTHAHKRTTIIYSSIIILSNSSRAVGGFDRLRASAAVGVHRSVSTSRWLGMRLRLPLIPRGECISSRASRSPRTRTRLLGCMSPSRRRTALLRFGRD